ncbi:hypothetical protein D3C80_1447290 [compost metagenome]
MFTLGNGVKIDHGKLFVFVLKGAEIRLSVNLQMVFFFKPGSSNFFELAGLPYKSITFGFIGAAAGWVANHIIPFGSFSVEFIGQFCDGLRTTITGHHFLNSN